MDPIFHRISVRRFETRPVEPEKIEQILRAAMQAPSAGNQQPWEFYLVRNPDQLAGLAACSPYAGCVAAAPLAIVSAARRNCRIPAYADIDMSIAMENMWLETDALGLGGVWLGIAPDEERMRKVEAVVGIPDSQRAFGIFALGYPAEARPQQDRFDRSRIHEGTVQH